jgi:hypothetical protein
MKLGLLMGKLQAHNLKKQVAKDQEEATVIDIYQAWWIFA